MGKLIPTSVKLDPETKKKLQILAEKERRSANGYIRELIERAWEQQNEQQSVLSANTRQPTN